MVDRLTGKKVIGIKQAIKAVRNDEGKCVYIADDAEEKLIQPLLKLAKEKHIAVNKVNTMKELGKLCGIEVGASAVVLLKD